MRTLFARHRVAIYRWLLRLVGDEALAEDLLSDVFLDVWRKAASFGGRSSVSTWLLAIARYKGLSARRRRTDAELNDELASSVADPSDDPELVLQKRNREELLRQGGRRDCRHQRGHGENAYVLRAQEAGGVDRERVVTEVALRGCASWENLRNLLKRNGPIWHQLGK
jgi:hypothetical protein